MVLTIYDQSREASTCSFKEEALFGKSRSYSPNDYLQDAAMVVVSRQPPIPALNVTESSWPVWQDLSTAWKLERSAVPLLIARKASQRTRTTDEGISRLLNLKTDPCTNLYQKVCGNSRRNVSRLELSPLPGSLQARWLEIQKDISSLLEMPHNVGSTSAKKVRIAYNACMKEGLQGLFTCFIRKCIGKQ
ncbi:uncharacterized protein LOC142802695 [Rhipicephalus microplus]|uniref:uncharacterized protein LOC142802695 n=1 Tax=Rhipicephalus microplus TaxID=6941 RepID=UPI003F6CD42C